MMIHHQPTMMNGGSFLRRRALLLLAATIFLLSSHVSEAQGGGSVSKGPALKTDKSKIQMLQSYAPAMRRNPDQEDNVSAIGAVEGVCPVGEMIDGNCKVHPLVVAYMEEDEVDSGHFDIHAAVSLDEGSTWKRINLSNNVKRTSTYKGRPCFSKEGHDDGDEPDHDGGGRLLQDHDGDTTDEFWFQGDNEKPMIVAKKNHILIGWTSKNCKGGVPGNQGAGEGPYGGDNDGHDPYNVLKETDPSDRHLVKGRQNCHDYTGELPGDPQKPFSCVWAARGRVDGKYGDIIWTKPERLTSGRRDAFQLTAQATVVNEQTVWAMVWQEDPQGLRVGEAEGPGDGMSGATVNHKTDIWYSYLPAGKFDYWEPIDSSNRWDIKDDARFVTPVRVTDNAACKVEYSEIEGVEYIQYGAPYCREDYFCDSIKELTDDDFAKKASCVTADGVVLDGDTGASRPNMFLIPEGNTARVVLAYEESKGLGKGPGDNHDETGESGEPADREDWGKNIYYHTFLYDDPDEIAHGTRINLPELGVGKFPVPTSDGTEFLTLNARRVRMIVQPPSNWGDEKLAMVLLYREGAEGHGHPAHIIMRRFYGGYDPGNIECTMTRMDPSGKTVCVEGSTDLIADHTPEPGQLDNARAHRGFLRGDMLVVGYTYTPVWGGGNSCADRMDFFVRRSFDGGKKFTNFHGIKEDPINLSNIMEEGNRGWSVMEPRLYATPGTIGGNSPKTANDVQNEMVYYAAFSTTHNPHAQGVSCQGEKDKPQDLYWTMTDNFGESYRKDWNEEAQKWMYPWLARVKGDSDDAGFAGAQIQTNPAGTKLFASFQADVINIADAATGGGPCNGNGSGSDVCSNTTAVGDTLVDKYDLDGNGCVDNNDLSQMKKKGNPFDINEDGVINAKDFKIMEAAIEQFSKRGTCPRRRMYLRGGV